MPCSLVSTRAHARVDAAKDPAEAGAVHFLSMADAGASLMAVTTIWLIGTLFLGLVWVVLRSRGQGHE
ncbi:hypothetical protein [Acidimangrovimonas sediminis]|uniref:hypothetical protein n=1 Tax=Acidimangrovimonas sediminis TaxID=2056283 RepID=UPI001E52A31B|nr:hypothetical protein [Acidimangrovimonas sediminis]